MLGRDLYKKWCLCSVGNKGGHTLTRSLACMMRVYPMHWQSVLTQKQNVFTRNTRNSLILVASVVRLMSSSSFLFASPETNRTPFSVAYGSVTVWKFKKLVEWTPLQLHIPRPLSVHFTMWFSESFVVVWHKVLVYLLLCCIVFCCVVFASMINYPRIGKFAYLFYSYVASSTGAV